MLAFTVSLYDVIHIFIISGVFPNCIKKCLAMIGNWMHVLGEDCTNSIGRGICLNFKLLL